MQVISSLLSLQANNMIDSAVQVQFQESQSRIRSMALVHEHLYQSDNLAAIDFCRYAHDLLAYLDSIHYISAHGIRLHIQTEDILLDIDSTLVCGLIINELVSNAAKHAFPNDAQGLIAVRLKKERSEHLVLSVQDNGIGLPEAYDFHNPLTLGLQLVFNLTRQLGGTIRIDQKSGTKVQIKFAAPKH